MNASVSGAKTALDDASGVAKGVPSSAFVTRFERVVFAAAGLAGDDFGSVDFAINF
jgi:hypothetical protein